MKLIFIYGPPAVGKLTVATELGHITGFGVFDDHLSIDSLLPVFGSLPKSRDKLVEQIRLAVIEEAARVGVDLIFTFVYAHPEDIPYVDRIWAAVERHGGVTCPVQIVCSSAAQHARVVHVDRARFKRVNSVEIVREWDARHELRTVIPDRASLTIDNTEMAPADVALRIAQHCQLPIEDAGV